MNKITKTLLESGVILAAGLALVGALMFAFAQNANADSGKRGPHEVGSTLEVIINDSGKAVVRGAEVTAVNDSSITARTQWDEASVTWTVRTDGDTQYLRKNGAGADHDDIEVGDYVSFSGAITGGSASAFTIDADVVKNWSMSESGTVYVGTVTSIDEDGDSFDMKTKSGMTVTVETDNDTNFTGGSFGSLDVNDRVVVSGSFDDDDDTITATKVSLGVGAVVEPVKGGVGNWMKNFPILKWFGKHDK